MRLVICGNGFDLHHGLITNYFNYKKYLEKNDNYAKACFENLIIDKKDAWKDVEESLNFDYSKYIDDVIAEYKRNPTICLKTYFDEELNFLYRFTGEYFARWLEMLDYSLAMPDSKLSLSKDDLYITFNYTETLNKLYGIPDTNVLFIHGRLKNIDSSCFVNGDIFSGNVTSQTAESAEPIVRGDKLGNIGVRRSISFGGDEKKVKLMFIDAKNKYEKDIEFASLIKEIEEVISATTKNVEENYDKLKIFLEGKNIDEVVIMGHSLSEPDFSYYTEILIPKLYKSKWTVMRHNPADSFGKLESLIGKKVNIIDW